MPIQSSDTRHASRTIRATDQDGVTRDVCHISGSIKDGSIVSIQLNVLTPSIVAECMEDVRREAMTFVSGVFADAGATGVPIAAFAADG